MTENKLISNPQYLIRTVVENNPTEVRHNAEDFGYNGTGEENDLIAFIHGLVKDDSGKQALEIISNVEFIENKSNSRTLDQIKDIQVKLQNKRSFGKSNTLSSMDIIFGKKP